MKVLLYTHCVGGRDARGGGGETEKGDEWSARVLRQRHDRVVQGRGSNETNPPPGSPGTQVSRYIRRYTVLETVNNNGQNKMCPC